MSVERAWNPYTVFDWPEKLDPASEYYMSPELISLYGTDIWDNLDETQRKVLSFYEIGNLFSFVLLGEKPVVTGMADRLYRKDTVGPITDYLHHFIDEENRHMVMFNTYCQKYLGKIYPEKKLVVTRDYAAGEEDIVFYCRVLIVEELGDVYNLKMQSDERINPLVRDINAYHHKDEARHLAFGRAWAVELFNQHTSRWSGEELERFQSWLAEYFASSWTDFYNPSVYRDAGLENSYELRQMALKDPICRRFREESSKKLVKFFVENGFLKDAPVL